MLEAKFTVDLLFFALFWLPVHGPIAARGWGQWRVFFVLKFPELSLRQHGTTLYLTDSFLASNLRLLTTLRLLQEPVFDSN